MSTITPPTHPMAGRPPIGPSTGAGPAPVPVPVPAQRPEVLPRVPHSGRGRLARWLLVAVAAGVVGTSLAIDPEGLVIVPILFALVVPFEKLFPRHRQKLRRPQVGTDIGYALAGPILTTIAIAGAVVVAVVSLAWLPGLAIRPLVGLIPPVAMPFVGIALFDLAIYWTHRWYHEVPVLWRFHAIHHSPEHMDWVSGFRNHPFDGTLIAPAFVFLLAAGFSPEFTGALAVIQIVLGIFLHANVRWRLRPLHKIVITPEFHHWHHANEPGAINSNYSVFLPAWDLLFGTYFMPRNRRPQVYGVTEHIPTGMAAQLWHPFRGMGNPLRAVRHPIESLKATFRFVRSLLADMKKSAKRPRRRSPEDLGPDFPDGYPVPVVNAPEPWAATMGTRQVHPALLRQLPPPGAGPVVSTAPVGPGSQPPTPSPSLPPSAPPLLLSPAGLASFPPPGSNRPPFTAIMPAPPWQSEQQDRTTEWPSSTPMAEVMGWDHRSR